MKYKLYDLYINFTYIYKRNNKSFHLKYKNGDIIITGNQNFSEKDFLKFIETFKDKIYKFYKSCKQKDLAIKPSNYMHFLGKKYEIRVVDSDILCQIKDDFIYVTSRYDEEKIIKDFYTKEALAYITNRFDSIYFLYKDLDDEINLKFKYTNTFYGKCYPKRKIIQFSGMLMKYDPIYIDSVIHHEICHLKYLAHDKDFYNYFNMHFNNAKQIQHKLRMTKYNDKY